MMNFRQKPALTALKITLAYALLSFAWIFFSDQLLAASATTVENVTILQLVKGWAFVLITSALIFYLMQREVARFYRADESQRTSEVNFKLLRRSP
jgi:hypothetical protein